MSVMSEWAYVMAAIVAGFGTYLDKFENARIEPTNGHRRSRMKPTKTRPMSEKAKARAKARRWADLRKQAAA